MPGNATVTLTGSDWVELTDANVTNIRIQNQSANPVHIQATTGAAPANAGGSILIPAYETLPPDLTLAQLWPGVSGADRIWALGVGDVSYSFADA